MAKQTYEQYKKEMDRKTYLDTAKQTATVIAKKIDKAGKEVTQYNPTIKQGNTGNKAFKGATKAYKPTKKLSTTLLSYGSSSSSRSVQPGPGRPKGVMKWRSPFNGQPIPATEYYKQVRAFRRLQTQKAEQVELQRQAQFAKQGIQPRQIQNVVQERMRQQFLQQQMQRQVPQRVMPQQVPTQVQNGTVIDRSTPVWRFRRGVVDMDWTAFGTRQVERLSPKSFWN